MPNEWKRDPATTDPSGFGGLKEVLARHERQIAALQTRAAINNATMTGLLKVLGSVLVSGGGGITIADDGTLTVDGNVIVGGTADFSGDTTIGGNLAVTGTLSLPAGIVDNDALANPSMPGSIYAQVKNFGLTTTMTNVLTFAVTVPDGFTIAHVTSVIGRVFAYNNTPGLDYLYGETNIAGANGWALPLAVSGNDGSGTNVSTFTTTLTGLTPGSTFNVELAAMSTFAPWAVDAGNTAELSGSITWYR